MKWAIRLLKVAFLVSLFPVAPAGAQTKKPVFTGDPVADTRRAFDQTKEAVTGKPADPTAPVACGFKMFVHLTPDNLEQTVKNCVATANGKLITDVKGALDSAVAFNNNAGDKDGMACLQPAYAIVQAAAFTPYVPAVPAVMNPDGTVKTPEVPAVESKEPGLVTLFQKYREFTLSGGLTACQNWINQPTQLTAAAGVAGIATIAGAALLIPK